MSVRVWPFYCDNLIHFLRWLGRRRATSIDDDDDDNESSFFMGAFPRVLVDVTAVKTKQRSIAENLLVDLDTTSLRGGHRCHRGHPLRQLSFAFVLPSQQRCTLCSEPLPFATGFQ